MDILLLQLVAVPAVCYVRRRKTTPWMTVAASWRYGGWRTSSSLCGPRFALRSVVVWYCLFVDTAPHDGNRWFCPSVPCGGIRAGCLSRVCIAIIDTVYWNFFPLKVSPRDNYKMKMTPCYPLFATPCPLPATAVASVASPDCCRKSTVSSTAATAT